VRSLRAREGARMVPKQSPLPSKALPQFCILQFTFCILHSLLLPTALCLGLSATPVLAAEPNWLDSRNVGPFVVQATFSLEPHQRLLNELPELQRELSRTLGIPAATQPITLCLFAEAEEHKRYLAEHFPQVPYRRALFIKSDGVLGVYAYRQAELDIDLRHECTHALLHSVLSDVPLWLDEGLAEYRVL
jgi:hypothetical protein